MALHMDKIEALKDKLTTAEYACAKGKHRRGQLDFVAEDKANELFQFFLIGRDCKAISELTGFSWPTILGTAIEYEWFQKKEELKKDNNIKNIAVDTTNNIFLLNTILLNRELNKVLTDPTYKAEGMAQNFICKNIKDYQDLIKTTYAANELQSLLTAKAPTATINNINGSVSNGKIESNEPEQLDYVDVEELTEEERIKQLESEKAKRGDH